MGQKVRPTGFRVGVMETWRSRWYAPKREFGDLLLEDFKIRKFVNTKYEFAEIAKLEIERTRDQVVVHMHTARPGVIIGRKGQEVDKLKAELEDLTGRRMDVKIVEITNPNRNARLVAMKIAQQLQKHRTTLPHSGVREGAPFGKEEKGMSKSGTTTSLK